MIMVTEIKQILLNSRVFLVGFVFMIAMGLFSGVESLAQAATTGSFVDIRADRQTYHEEKRESRFLGNVSVTYQNVSIEGKEASLSMNTDGSPQEARFYNRPHAKRVLDNPSANTPPDTLEADLIRILLSENEVRAEGNVITHMKTLDEGPIDIFSHVQTFNHDAQRFLATGDVELIYQDTHVYSPKAYLYFNDEGRPDRMMFLEGVRVSDERAELQGEKVTVMPQSGNLIAENNVDTIVKLQPAPESAEKLGDDKLIAENRPHIRIRSSYQQYDKASQTVLASGNVVINYDDYHATGSKAVFKLNQGKVDNILLTGRPKIQTSGRVVEADKITITTEPKHFNAYGNVRTKFQTEEAGPGGPSTVTQPAVAGEATGAGDRNEDILIEEEAQ